MIWLYTSFFYKQLWQGLKFLSFFSPFSSPAWISSWHWDMGFILWNQKKEWHLYNKQSNVFICKSKCCWTFYNSSTSCLNRLLINKKRGGGSTEKEGTFKQIIPNRKTYEYLELFAMYRINNQLLTFFIDVYTDAAVNC